MAPLRSTLFAAAAALTVGGCVPEGGFPLLAPRPGERDLSVEEPVHARVPVADDAALRARVAELTAQAAEGDRAFESAYPPAASAVAAAEARESDLWVVAQQALSRLEAARTPTTRALAELDGLAVARAATPTSDADFALIAETKAAVERIAAAQQSRFDALQARLSGP